MSVLRIAAFAKGEEGGNPAGVWLGEGALPEPGWMQAQAAAIGYSETVFSARDGDAWRTRYFSPETEVPFCGHATIALGAALALSYGAGAYALALNDAAISVTARRDGDGLSAALRSPPTRHRRAPEAVITQALALFGYGRDDLDPKFTPVVAEAGARHLLLALNSRDALARMAYDLDAGRRFMRGLPVETVSLVFADAPDRFHARNPFAAGGVYEDPATGAAAAALAGYLRDAGDWPHAGPIQIAQGDDMGAPCRITAHAAGVAGDPVTVSGAARVIAA